MAHSKRNTSLPHFTSYERSLLHTTWGTQKTRLSRESFLPFASCHLCLLPAQEPVVACATNGDIFCRECAVNNLLAQHQEIKRLEKARLLAEEERRDGVERSIADARARELRDFEMTSMGLDVRKRKSAAAVPTDSAPANETAEGTAKKRRRDFKLDGDEVKRASEQELDKARREAEEERSKSSESQLHSFWVPALTPSANAPEGPRRKLSPICPASTEDQSHPYSLKTLVAVHFTTEIDEKTGETRRICPSCRKGLTNGSKAILTKPCGH
ncbi:hypothetical protein KEM52_001826 [Ascosphaera acerosa]|nr:hypothetical protein KEM52_001826 [Ascosphaera acerosa]